MPTTDEYQALLELSELAKMPPLPVASDPTYKDSQSIALRNLRSAMSPAVQRSANEPQPQAKAEPASQPAVQSPDPTQDAPKAEAVAPSQAPLTVDPASAMMLNIGDMTKSYAESVERQNKFEREALDRKQRTIQPAIEGVQQQVLNQLKSPSHAPLQEEPPQPSIKPRPFLTPDASNAIQTLVAGLGTIAMNLAGLKSPTAALSSLTGAMTGWAEGDAVRAEREWKEYESRVSKMQRENEKALKLYEVARTQRADDMQAAQANLQASLLSAGMNDYAVEIGEKGLERGANLIYMSQQQLQNFFNNQHKLLSDTIRMMTLPDVIEKRRLDIEATKQKIEAGKETLSDETLRSMAEQYLAGDATVKQNVGRGVQGPKDLRRLNEMIYKVGKEKNMGGQDIAAAIGEYQGFKAEQRSRGTRLAALRTASTVAEKLIPAVKDASDALDRTDIPILNRALKNMNLGLPVDEELNEKQVQLSIAMNSLMYTYARALNPTGQARIGDLEHAREMLIDTWGKGAIDAGLRQIQIELAREREALQTVKEESRAEFKGAPPKIEIPSPAEKKGPLSPAEKKELEDLRKWQKANGKN